MFLQSFHPLSVVTRQFCGGFDEKLCNLLSIKQMLPQDVEFPHLEQVFKFNLVDVPEIFFYLICIEKKSAYFHLHFTWLYSIESILVNQNEATINCKCNEFLIHCTNFIWIF